MEYYVTTATGAYLGAWDTGHPDAPTTETEVGSAPSDAGQIWQFPGWGAVPAILKIIALAEDEAAEKHFHNINYKLEIQPNLHPKRSFTFGTLDNVKWYSDSATTDLILEVAIIYNYDSLGFSTDRTVTRTWYLDDDTADANTKVTTKYYTINPQDQLDEAIRRRINNVRQTNVNLIGIVPQLTIDDTLITDMTDVQVRDSGVEFFTIYTDQESIFISTGGTDLEDAVRDDIDAQFDWFNTDATSLGITGVVDIRGYIIYQLSAGVRTS